MSTVLAHRLCFADGSHDHAQKVTVIRSASSRRSRRPSERFQLPVAGRWYFGLMILIGGVSLTSLNNVVYLMEALLISGATGFSRRFQYENRALSLALRFVAGRFRPTAKTTIVFHLVNPLQFPRFLHRSRRMVRRQTERLAFRLAFIRT